MSLMQKRRSVITMVGLTGVTSMWMLAGCSQSGDNAGGSVTQGTTTQGASGGGDTTLIAAGKAVYDANGCANCHAISGQGGNKAPELTHTGAASEHTAEWLVTHVRDPKSHNPGSRMPAFNDKISDKDLMALGAYLASLK